MKQCNFLYLFYFPRTMPHIIYISVNILVLDPFIMSPSITIIGTLQCVQLVLFLENILGEKSWVEETCENINEPECPAG